MNNKGRKGLDYMISDELISKGTPLISEEARIQLNKPYTYQDYSGLFTGVIKELLEAEPESLLSITLRYRARQARNIYFPDGPNLRAVIEVSNKCRVNCKYCAMSRNNKELERYTLSEDGIVECAREVYNIKPETFYFSSGEPYVAKFKRLFLQSGEDPSILDVMIPAVKRISSEMPEFEIVGCMGEFRKHEYKALKDAGMHSYILKFEVSNPELYRELRGRDIKDRLKCLGYLKELKFNVGTGDIVNLPGQTMDDLVNDLRLIQELRPSTASVCPFMPNEGSEYGNKPMGKLNDSLNMNSVLRLLSPMTCTASCSPYEKLKPGMGQIDGFDAGCTNITIRMTPEKVAHLFELYNRDRTTIKIHQAYAVIKYAVENWGMFE